VEALLRDGESGTLPIVGFVAMGNEKAQAIRTATKEDHDEYVAVSLGRPNGDFGERGAPRHPAEEAKRCPDDQVSPRHPGGTDSLPLLRIGWRARTPFAVFAGGPTS
jgi:hypothetical protein